MPSDLVKVNTDNYPLTKPNCLDVLAIITQNCGDSIREFDLTTVRIPAGGGTMWTIPAPEGPVCTQALVGIIGPPRISKAFWDRPLSSGAGAPPDCWSMDGLVGCGLFAGRRCSTCDMNAWGSLAKRQPEKAGSMAKACRDSISLFILQERSILPLVLRLPPTSFKNWKQYAYGLANVGHYISHVITEITLAQIKQAGPTYSVAQFRMIDVLSPEARQNVSKAVDQLEKIIARPSLDQMDVFDAAIESSTTTPQPPPDGPRIGNYRTPTDAEVLDAMKEWKV